MNKIDSISYPEQLSGVLKRKNQFIGMWRNCICEFKNGKFILHQGLSEKIIDKTIPITQDTLIEMKPGEKGTKFTIRQPENGGELLFACETPEEARKWVQVLRGETFKTDSLSINDFNIISCIGRGYYGKVMLVSKKDSGKLYAIKSVKKSRLIENGKMEAIITEKNILMKANYCFIVRIKFAFQSETKFYIGMEYVSGGELFSLYDEKGKFLLEEARLYLAEIALGIQYLHSIGIIYRDLKLENIMLDADGHIKIVDFGLSKDISFSNETKTFCGTPEYIAPEVILEKPYDYKVDWWAFGILTYELLFGDTPFYRSNNKKILEAVLKSQPIYPENTPKYVIDFINRLLEKDPVKRATLGDLKNHQFWNGLNFDDVEKKKYEPFYVPKMSSTNLCSNFSSCFTKEPAIDSLATPPSLLDSKNELYSGFSMSEDSFGIDPQDQPSETIQPSSILTLQLVEN